MLEQILSIFEQYGSALALVGLTLLSAVFSGTETAFIAASKVRLHRMEKEGSVAASRVLLLKQELPILISSILFCNTLINIFASALATHLFVEMFGDAGVFIATGVMAAALVIYAEVLPKILAITFAESYAVIVSPMVRVVLFITSPVTRFMDFYARMNLRLFGLKKSPDQETVDTVEELRGIIDLHGRSGVEARDEQLMLQSILDLGNVAVEEVMIHRKNMFCVDGGLPASEIVRQILDCPYTRVPIYIDNQDNIVGILHVKSFIRAVTSKTKVKLESIDVLGLASKPWFVPETRTLLSQMHAFRKRGEHVALVVDEYGDIQGLLTLEDILEEIVGDITDETDQDESNIFVNKKGEIMVDGKVTIRDLNRRFEWELPDEEASTLAGLVLEETMTIPEMGQIFVIHNLEIEVLRRVGNQITLLKITEKSPQS